MAKVHSASPRAITPHAISIGNHMLLSAIIPKLHEKACNCLLTRGIVAKGEAKKVEIFAREHYSAKISHNFCVTNLP